MLFLGDNGHHRPADRFRQLQPVLASGIDFTYSDKPDMLDPAKLSGLRRAVIYANTTRITPSQEKALRRFRRIGQGFISLHCASYCFLNSPRYIDLVGAQFQRHGTGTFRVTEAMPDHPIMKGFKGFESWDETYVHTKHNEKDRLVLEYRDDNGRQEPWTWVRTQGKGRIFYTAWGHDQRTWGNPGFQALVERGIRWSVGRDPGVVPAAGATGATRAGLDPFTKPFVNPVMTPLRKDVKPFEHVDVGRKIPNHPRGRTWAQNEPFHLMQKPSSARSR